MVLTQQTPSYSDTLSSLAILRVQSLNQQDYLQNFVPFLAECVKKCKTDIITANEVRALFLSTFGLKVPVSVVKILLEKAASQDIVRTVNKTYQRNNKEIAGLTLETDRATAKRELDDLLNKFRTFSETELGRTIGEEKAEQVLYDFIREYGSDTLLASQHPISNEESDQYLAGAFVKYLGVKDASGFAYLENAVKGSMMASMLHYSNPNSIGQPWENAAIYLDTPLLLRALRLYGAEIQAPYIELIEALKSQGVQVRCFTRTTEEIQGVLYSIGNRLQSGSKTLQTFEELGEELLATSYSTVDIRLLAAGLEERLESIGVSVLNEPPNVPHLILDVTKAEQIFQGILHYGNPNACEHDVQAVLAMYRLRQGRHVFSVERSEALFITTNTKVVGATHEVMRQLTSPFSNEISWCMQHDALATLLWLKNPATLTDLPRKQIIADALAAIKPSAQLWEMYLSEINSLREKGEVDEKQITYLRCDAEAVSALTRITHNDFEAYSEGTVAQVLESSRAAIRRDLEIQLEQEQLEKARVDAELARATELSNAGQQLVAQKEGEVANLSTQVIDLSKKASAGEKQKNHLLSRISTASKAVAWLIFYIFWGIFLMVTWHYRLSKSLPIDLSSLDTIKSATLSQWLWLLPFGLLAFLAFSPLSKKAREIADGAASKLSAYLTRILIVSDEYEVLQS